MREGSTTRPGCAVLFAPQRAHADDSHQGYERNIWTMNADGTGQRQLTHVGRFNVTPSWQPVPTTPAAAGLPAVPTTRPSRPTPEARLVAVFFRAEDTLYADSATALENSPAVALVLGSQLIRDAATFRRQTVAISVKTSWGKKFKRGALAMYASTRAAGEKFNAAILAALLGHRGQARNDVTAALTKIVGIFIREGELSSVL